MTDDSGISRPTRLRLAAQLRRVAVWMLAFVTMTPAAIAAPGDDASDLVVAGDTLRVWRERMSVLVLNDPANTRFVPGLIHIIRQTDVPWFTRRQAALTLGRMGPHAEAAVPVMIEMLQADDPPPDQETQLWLIKALGLYGPVARDAAPVLITTYRSREASDLSRLSIIDTLSQIGPAHVAAIPFLVRVAGDGASSLDTTGSHHSLQRAAVEALGMIGPSAVVAVPTLVRVLDDADENLRREAASSLGKFGASAGIAAPSLLERLVLDDSPAVQDAAAVALARFDPVDAAERLQEFLSSDDPELRRRIVEIFGRWGSASIPWAETVQRHWDDPDANVRLSALEASWLITQQPSEIARRIVGELTDEDRGIRRRAFVLFTRLGRLGRAAATELQKQTSDPRPEIRRAAEKALQTCCYPEAADR